MLKDLIIFWLLQQVGNAPTWLWALWWIAFICDFFYAVYQLAKGN